MAVLAGGYCSLVPLAVSPVVEVLLRRGAPGAGLGFRAVALPVLLDSGRLVFAASIAACLTSAFSLCHRLTSPD